MDNVTQATAEADLKKVFGGVLLHIVAVTITYLSATVFYSLIQEGVGSASERLSISSNSLFARIAPLSQRLNRLIELPDNYGFVLYSGELFTPSNYRNPRQNDDDDDDGNKNTNTHKPDNKNGKNQGDTPDAKNDIQMKDFITFCKNLKNLEEDTRKDLLIKAKTLRFTPQSVTSFLLAVAEINIGSQSAALEENQRLLFSEFMLLPPRGFNRYFSKKDIDYISTKFTYPQIVTTIENGTVMALKNLLPEKVTSSTDTTTVKPTKTTVTTVTQAPKTQSDYKELENNELLYNACLTRQDILQEAHKKYERASSSSVDKLNITELMEMGFLDNAPSCPGNGSYSLSEGLVTCSSHGNRVTPYRGHIEYLRHFKRFHHAEDAFISGKYKEALFLVEKIVKTNKEHNQAVELLGHCLMKLKLWARAATTLQEAAMRYGDDGKLHYEAALCFFASGNKNLAQNHLNQCINSKWKDTQRSILKPLDFYLLKDRARWMLPFIKKTSYLNFMLEKEPVFPTSLCHDSLFQLREKIRDWTGQFMESEEIVAVKQKMSLMERQLAGLRTFETDEIDKAKKRIEAVKEIFRNTMEGTGPDSLAVFICKKLAEQDNSMDFCPGYGRYFVDTTDNMNCSLHSKILENSNISTSFNFSPEAIKLMNDAILSNEYNKYPERKQCHDKQDTLVSKMDKPLDAGSLVKLRKTASYNSAMDVCPYGSSRYKIEKSVFSRTPYIIICNDHGSKADFNYIPGSSHD